jgi:hypothetical protein
MRFKQFQKLVEEPMWHGDRSNVFVGHLSGTDQLKLKNEWQKRGVKFKKSMKQPDSFDFPTATDLGKANQAKKDLKLPDA